jgi:hypothetical protein
VQRTVVPRREAQDYEGAGPVPGWLRRQVPPRRPKVHHLGQDNAPGSRESQENGPLYRAAHGGGAGGVGSKSGLPFLTGKASPYSNGPVLPKLAPTAKRGTGREGPGPDPLAVPTPWLTLSACSSTPSARPVSCPWLRWLGTPSEVVDYVGPRLAVTLTWLPASSSEIVVALACVLY